jgi:hypothetical protein
MEKLIPILHIFGRREPKMPYFPIHTFAFAQSPCNGLHCPTSSPRVGWQPYNGLVGIRAVVSNIKVVCATLCPAWFKNSSTDFFFISYFLIIFWRSVWVRNGVLCRVDVSLIQHSVESQVLVWWNQTTLICVLQGTILGVKTFYPE